MITLALIRITPVMTSIFQHAEVRRSPDDGALAVCPSRWGSSCPRAADGSRRKCGAVSAHAQHVPDNRPQRPTKKQRIFIYQGRQTNGQRGREIEGERKSDRLISRTERETGDIHSETPRHREKQGQIDRLRRRVQRNIKRQ
jgi:hypothetical protein